MLDEKFYFAVSFCILIYIIYKPAKSFIYNMLDEKINLIKQKQQDAEDILYHSKHNLKNAQDNGYEIVEECV
jgi:F0F1-type ATP synthase membrane subunit b/b'